MLIQSFQLGQIGTNCYLLGDEQTRLCAVIDPGDDGNYVAGRIAAAGLTPAAILLTHAHFDHILGIPELRAAYPEIPVYVHKDELNHLNKADSFFGLPVPVITDMGPLTFYGEGDTVAVGGLTVQVLHTPGHTEGSVTLRVDDVLFTGDTLFRGSCGRTDLPGGSDTAILHSLKRLSQLEGDLKVYPGHEGGSSLDFERKVNCYMIEAMGL